MMNNDNLSQRINETANKIAGKKKTISDMKNRLESEFKEFKFKPQETKKGSSLDMSNSKVVINDLASCPKKDKPSKGELYKKQDKVYYVIDFSNVNIEVMEAESKRWNATITQKRG